MNTPVTPDEVLLALRAILGQIGPDMMAYSSIRYAYDLIERIDANGGPFGLDTHYFEERN